MKLDRNINPDGRGKYALINLRTNQVQWGGDGDQFFVIKYKDEFAWAAITAYSNAVKSKVATLHGQSLIGLPPGESDNPAQVAAFRADKAREAESLSEYAEELDHEAELAKNWPTKKLPD